MNPKKKAFLLPIANKRKQKLIANATKAEICFKAMLIRSKIPFKFQFIVWTYTSFFILDFLLENKEGKRYAIELDGFAVHGSWQAKKRDKNRSSVLRKKGIGVLRFDNNDILNKPEKVKNKLKRYGII